MSKEKSLSVTELKALIKDYQKINCPKLPSKKSDLQALAQQYNIPLVKRSSVRLEQKQKKSKAVSKVGTKANLISQLVQATGKPKSHFTKMLKSQLEEALQYENFIPPPAPSIPMPLRSPPMRPIEFKNTDVPVVSRANIQEIPISQPLQSKLQPTGIRVMRILETKPLRPRPQPLSAKEKLQKKLKKKMEERKSKK